MVSSEEINPDIIFWTGDNSSHNIYNNTVDEIIDYTGTITGMIKEAIKDKKITMLPLHGNHDTWPVDEQDFEKPGLNIPIQDYSKTWKEWLGDAANEYVQYGYYSKDISTLVNGKTLPAGSRLIAYNTNVCDSLNFNIWGERDDPGHHYEWLKIQLEEIEAAGGLAIMMGHYTPQDCQH